MTARRLRNRRFEVVECATVDEFRSVWKPGVFDVIVADWELTKDPAKHGDRILIEVRKLDWDVPFVLLSGQLEQEVERAQILQRLLKSGSARFVRRGSNHSIDQACDDADDLIERRDLTLLKILLSLREGAMAGETIQTSSRDRMIAERLERGPGLHTHSVPRRRSANRKKAKCKGCHKK